MTFEVRLGRAAQKGLDAISGRNYQRVAGAIRSLEEDARPAGVKKLAESALWRIRVGQYRIVYAIDDDAYLVTIVRLARRSEDTYKYF